MGARQTSSRQGRESGKAHRRQEEAGSSGQRRTIARLRMICAPNGERHGVSKATVETNKGKGSVETALSRAQGGQAVAIQIFHQLNGGPSVVVQGMPETKGTGETQFIDLSKDQMKETSRALHN